MSKRAELRDGSPSTDSSSDAEFDPYQDLTTQLAEAAWEKFLASLHSQHVLSDDEADIDFNPAIAEADHTLEYGVWSGFVANVLGKTDELAETIRTRRDELCNQVRAALQLTLQTVILCHLCFEYHDYVDEMTKLLYGLAGKAKRMAFTGCPTRTALNEFLEGFVKNWQESISRDTKSAFLVMDLPPCVGSMIAMNPSLFPRPDLVPPMRFQSSLRIRGPPAFCEAEDFLLLLANERFKHFAVEADRICMIQKYVMPCRSGPEIHRRLRRLNSKNGLFFSNCLHKKTPLCTNRGEEN